MHFICRTYTLIISVPLFLLKALEVAYRQNNVKNQHIITIYLKLKAFSKKLRETNMPVADTGNSAYLVLAEYLYTGYRITEMPPPKKPCLTRCHLISDNGRPQSRVSDNDGWNCTGRAKGPLKIG